MREPVFCAPWGELIPFSRAPSNVLRLEVVGGVPKVLGDGAMPDQTDDDFMRRYATWLLSERGTIG